MYLIEILLPLYDNHGQPFGPAPFASARQELVDRFGGVTAHAQAPAQGIWEDSAGQVRRDDIVVFEVMTDHIDENWWSTWRARMERLFRQDEIVVRATEVRRL